MYTIEDIIKLPMQEELKQLIKRYEDNLSLSDVEDYQLHWNNQIEDVKYLLELFYENKMSFEDWGKMKKYATINREYRLGEINNGKMQRNFMLVL